MSDQPNPAGKPVVASDGPGTRVEPGGGPQPPEPVRPLVSQPVEPARALVPQRAVPAPGLPAVSRTAAPQGPAVPVPVPFFGPQWPGPGRVAPAVALVAAAVAGIVAAAALPWDRPGVGWLVTTVIAATGTVVAAHRAGAAATGPSWVRSVRVAWAVLAIALIAMAALRAAGWLFALCLPAAALAGALALTGGRSVRGLLLGVAAVPLAAMRALPWAVRGIAEVRGRTGGSAARTVAAALVGVALLILFAALFAGADAAFASLLDDVLPTVDAGQVTRWVLLFAVLALGTLAACFLAIAPPSFDGQPRARRSLRRVEWALPVGLLVALFATFVAVQLTVLFGGSRHVLVTTGLTYAEYARSGFWQLLVVTTLTLGVIALAAVTAPRQTVADRAWLRGLLGGLSVLTLVIVASALSRMWAYEQAYGFTRLRLLVSVCELWLGVVFLLVLLAGVRLGPTRRDGSARPRALWLPGAVIGTGLVALLVLAVVNPDRFIAERNVARLDRTGRIDLGYLSRLSADSVPALVRLPEPRLTCVLAAIDEELDGSAAREAWYEWNLGRVEARRLLVGYSPPTPAQSELCANMLRSPSTRSA